MSVSQTEPKGRILGVFAAAVIYATSAYLSQRLAVEPEGLLTVWLPYGLSALALSRFGIRLWPGVLLGALAAALLLGQSIATALADALPDTASIVLSAYLLRQINLKANLSTLYNYYLTVTALAAVSLLFDSVVSPSVPAWLGIALPLRDSVWLNSLCTALLLLPATLFIDDPRGWLPRQRWAEAGLLILATLIAGAIVLGGWTIWGHSVYMRGFLLFPLVLWGALRFGRHAVAIQLLVLFGLTLWGLFHGQGYFGPTVTVENLNIVWLYHIVLNMTGMTLAIAIKQRTRLKNQLRVAAQAFTHNREGIMITDTQNKIVHTNPAFSRITGYTLEEAKGRDPKFLSSGANGPEFYSAMWDKLCDCGQWEGEIWDRRKNGQIFPKWLSISVVKNQSGEILNYIGQFSDISDRKTQEEKMAHMAHFDPLTDLPNRALFSDRLVQAIAPARRELRNLALLFIDLDNFKPINDTYGHDVGDLLLKEAARRMQDCVHRESDTIARLGGDEFVALLPSAKHREDAELIAQRLLETLGTPFTLAGQTLKISCSIGIALYPQDGHDGHTLMQHADHAMYRAKRGGRNSYRFYSDGDFPNDYSI